MNLEPRLQRLPQVCERVGVSRSTLYRWMAERKFPQAVRIGDRTTAWDSRAVDRWIASHIAGKGVSE